MKKKTKMKIKKGAKAKMTLKLKKPKKSKSKLKVSNFKADDKVIRALHAKAKKHAQGNFSAWMRHAGLKYVPKKGETIRA